MTTAARPTFDSAKGGTGARERDLSALSKQYSARDLPSHTSLKSRDRGQNNPDDLSGRDFRRELEDRERAAARDKDSGSSKSKRESSSITSGSSGVKKLRVEQQQAPVSAANLDADDPIDDSDVNSDSDSDSDDDTAALMAELQKIKREKAAEEREKEDLKKQEEERIRMENILSGNPLLKEKYASSSAADKADMKVKRRWDDDVVFKNCSRAESDKKEKTFINDSLRSEFHRKFMSKYIQ